jgi:putative FmdB family regulatory protein
MPIYEYLAVDQQQGCESCRSVFEMLGKVTEPPLTQCSVCGGPVKRRVSRCFAAVTETSPESTQVERQVRDYEKSGQWSHAAELADCHAEKSRDRHLKTRALENYRKAGYDSAAFSGSDD